MRQIMIDLVNKQKNDGISKELWMIKKKMGLGRIMEAKKIISVSELWKIWSTKKK